MPIMQRLSDVVEMNIMKNERGQNILELQSRFIKMHLVVDDLDKAKELERIIKELANPLLQKEGETQRLPRFYKNKRSEQP